MKQRRAQLAPDEDDRRGQGAESDTAVGLQNRNDQLQRRSLGIVLCVSGVGVCHGR